MAETGEQAGKPWVIRDVPEETRRLVKAFAGRHGLTVADALTRLVEMALWTDAHVTPQRTSFTGTMAMAQEVIQEVMRRHEVLGGDMTQVRFTIETPAEEERKDE